MHVLGENGELIEVCRSRANITENSGKIMNLFIYDLKKTTTLKIKP